MKKYECTLKCTEILYKHSEDLHSKGNWWHFYTKSSFSLVMAFQLIAKFHIIPHSTRWKKNQASNWIFFFSFSQNMKNQAKSNWTYSGKKKDHSPRFKLKNDMKIRRKSICWVFVCLFFLLRGIKTGVKGLKIRYGDSWGRVQFPVFSVAESDIQVCSDCSLLWKGSLQSVFSGAVND